MKILKDSPLHVAAKGSKVFLTLFNRRFEHNNQESDYFCVVRGSEIVPHKLKNSDAVVVVAVYEQPDKEDVLVTTKEFRVPLGVRELGFVAGLIDRKDYECNATQEEAAIRAAIREMKEETGLELTVYSCSPPNLYSSAGLTNESITYVFGVASGIPSDKFLESSEDIQVNFLTKEEARRVLFSNDPELAHSKTAWPFILQFANGYLNVKNI